MKDIVFVQQYALPYFGIMSLNAWLGRSGLSADVLIDALEEDLIEAIKRLRPKLIGFSIFSTEHSWLKKTTETVSRHFPDIPIIIGGIHAIMYAEKILEETPATLACLGDGEKVLADVLKRVSLDFPNWQEVGGIAFKGKDGKVHMGERVDLMQFRDDIVEYGDIYYRKYSSLAKDTTRHFISGRGCPYACSFCQNAYLRKYFKGKGVYIRQKSVNNFIKEITSTLDHFPAKAVMFDDDLFTLNKKWLREFLALYKARVALPFICQTRADFVDEELARMLADAGCATIMFGIESGNEDIRTQILKKKISNEQIIRAGRMLNEHGMTVHTTNILCLPGETMENALETVKLSIDARATLFSSGLLMLFPDTELTESCRERGLIPADYSLKDIPASFFFSNTLKLPDKRKIINIHYLGCLFVRFPVLFRLFKWVVRFEALRPLYYCVYLVSHVFRYKTAKRMSLLEMIRFSLRMSNAMGWFPGSRKRC
ncbi:B12-binding domain-containing radical SAM protein [Elusimicrobiota bacterium]